MTPKKTNVSECSLDERLITLMNQELLNINKNKKKQQTENHLAKRQKKNFSIIYAESICIENEKSVSLDGFNIRINSAYKFNEKLRDRCIYCHRLVRDRDRTHCFKAR